MPHLVVATMYNGVESKHAPFGCCHHESIELQLSVSHVGCYQLASLELTLIMPHLVVVKGITCAAN